MKSKPSRLSSETRQTIINVCLTGGVACALTWSLMAAVSAGQARDMIESATAEPVASELVTSTAHVAEDVTPRTVIVTRDVPRDVVREVETVREVEVPVEVTKTVEVPDPTAYDRGYADARAEYEVSDDYLADWWEDGRDSGESTALRDLATALSTPCAQEDSDNCYWRADIMGNGEGESFVTLHGVTFSLTSVLSGGAS